MRNLSGGNVGLALLCQWWLRDDAEWEPFVTAPHIQEGTCVHKAIELDLKGKAVDVADVVAHEGLTVSHVAKVQKKYDLWRTWAEKERRVGWQPEKCVSYNVNEYTARELHGAGPARYSSVDRTCEVPMVLDVLSMGKDSEGDYVEVIDWKTGRVNPKDRQQILAGGVAASRLYDIGRAVGRAVYITDEVVAYRYEYDEFELTAMAARLQRVFKQQDTDPRPGTHCKQYYCRALPSCMKKMIEMGDGE